MRVLTILFTREFPVSGRMLDTQQALDKYLTFVWLLPILHPTQHNKGLVVCEPNQQTKALLSSGYGKRILNICALIFVLIIPTILYFSIMLI